MPELAHWQQMVFCRRSSVLCINSHHFVTSETGFLIRLDFTGLETRATFFASGTGFLTRPTTTGMETRATFFTSTTGFLTRLDFTGLETRATFFTSGTGFLTHPTTTGLETRATFFASGTGFLIRLSRTRLTHGAHAQRRRRGRLRPSPRTATGGHGRYEPYPRRCHRTQSLSRPQRSCLTHAGRRCGPPAGDQS